MMKAHFVGMFVGITGGLLLSSLIGPSEQETADKSA